MCHVVEWMVLDVICYVIEWEGLSVVYRVGVYVWVIVYDVFVLCC